MLAYRQAKMSSRQSSFQTLLGPMPLTANTFLSDTKEVESTQGEVYSSRGELVLRTAPFPKQDDVLYR